MKRMVSQQQVREPGKRDTMEGERLLTSSKMRDYGQRRGRIVGRGWKTVGRQQDKEGWSKEIG